MMDRDDYKFLAIKDAVSSINQKVNLIGVVVEFGLPRITRGTDCSCTFKIVDQSYPEHGISVNAFAGTIEKLPHIISTGDIVQLTRVTIKSHNTEVNAVLNKTYSTFAIYEGRDGQDFTPYQFSAKYHPRDQDKKFVAGLRRWLVEFKLDEGPSSYSMLREIKEGHSSHLLCKILHISEVAEGELIAFVWDGTDAPTVSLHTGIEGDTEKEISMQSHLLSLPRDILCKFPTSGTILRVTADRSAEMTNFNFLTAGKWTKILNLKCGVNLGLWHGVITCFTKFRHVSDNEPLVRERQRSFDRRFPSRSERIPYWSFPWPSRVTEVDYEEAPFSTLMDVLTFSKVTAKFKCAVRVIAAYPSQAEDFCSPIGTYRVRLTLEDPTARIFAYVYAEDGEQFFGGHHQLTMLKKKLSKLLGVGLNEYDEEIKSAPRNPPWVEICLKSYYLVKSDVWGSRHYRIFGTKLVG